MGTVLAPDVLAELYAAHYRRLVRVAVLILGDLATAEDVVQDAFVSMHHARDVLDPGAYLRQAVINGSRSVLRRQAVADRHLEEMHDEPSAERVALASLERSAVVTALLRLPRRQREVIVLRHYGGFSEAEIARAMGIRAGAVKSHAARARKALKAMLEAEGVTWQTHGRDVTG